MLDYVVVVQMEQDAGRINRRAVLVDGLRVRETQPIHACYLADASLQERGIVTANSLDVPPMFAKKLFIYLGYQETQGEGLRAEWVAVPYSATLCAI